ncbi:endonuclease [Gaetbulibacter sp. M240]|uniref:endonuclease n=1 Tax=Gaetbulibacter sp. M240 TaxID=3126511 RepID=UPI00374F779E
MNHYLLGLFCFLLSLNCNSGSSGNANPIDTGPPEANDDFYNTAAGRPLVMETLLTNDILVDSAVISDFDKTTLEGGTVLHNNDGSYTYTPPVNFIGDDAFTYTLCDNSQPSDCSQAKVTIAVAPVIKFNIPSQVADYYDSVVFADNTDYTFKVLKNLSIEKHTTILSYGQRHNYLYNADADLANPDNVILMYSGESRYWKEYTSGNNPYSPQTFNTEHIYPQSLLQANDAVTDLHHLRTCDAGVNSSRSNYPFAEGSGSYERLANKGWYPGDSWKGDVARMVMYLNIRYGETFDKVGGIELLLKWHVEDPVSPFELQRNAVIYGAQGNRNPFIDNPYLATMIWGGTPAENTWE